MAQHILKIKKVKRQETDGKPDTYSVNAECETATGLCISLTVACADRDELKTVISTVPGNQVTLRLAPVLYGDITTYGAADPADIKTSFMDKDEAARLMEALAAIDSHGPEEAEPEAMQEDPYREDMQADLRARQAAWQAQDRAEKDALLDARQAVKEAHQ